MGSGHALTMSTIASFRRRLCAAFCVGKARAISFSSTATLGVPVGDGSMSTHLARSRVVWIPLCAMSCACWRCAVRMARPACVGSCLRGATCCGLVGTKLSRTMAGLSKSGVLITSSKYRGDCVNRGVGKRPQAWSALMNTSGMPDWGVRSSKVHDETVMWSPRPK